MYDPPSPRTRAARALRPPSWYTARAAHGRPADAPEPDSVGEPAPRTYLTRLARPFDDPYEELCRSFNVHKSAVTLLPDGSVPLTVCMPVRRDAHMPTHALVVLPSTAVPSVTVTPSSSSSSPSPSPSPSPAPAPVLPINAELFAQHFTYDLARLSADDASAQGSTLPVPFYAAPGVQCVELPALALSLPHPPSAALLLFFGLGLPSLPPPPPPSPLPSTSASDAPESSSRRRSGASGLDTHTGLFAAFVLPVHVVAEFPSAPAMASALLRGPARAYPTARRSDSGSSAGSGAESESDDGAEPRDARAGADAVLGECTAFVGGLWANVLALGPRDGRIVDMVRCAWNVCREARRLRGLEARGRASRRGS
ncbi:hypothetical protein DAEQUDRAFT_770529 [Daedalea quercina L-15889]|uniref:Uncharacterized protein n=1 Tax=Daedalea quercina L-15889 TaxID=1314783 RepID=A0A165KSS3_9APHY|nr:hypothetical protein DAEQUDRAFT_770529 [Daedalea quercina L-15889]